jgi:hypothetical protein
MVYDPVRAASIGLATAYGPAVVYPVACYIDKSTFQVVAPGCTFGLSSNTNRTTHLGGHEIVIDGTWPATSPTDPPVGCSSSVFTDSSSPPRWELVLGNEVPWFAQYTMSTSNVGGVLHYAHTYEPIGPRTVDLPNLIFPRSMTSISPWSYLLSGLSDPDWQVCGNLSPPEYGDSPRPSIVKVREGSLFGRAGGHVPTGSTDVLWMRDSFARIYSYEGR